jgi:hypothetical protein
MGQFYLPPTDVTLQTSDVTTNNATTAKHGFLPKLSGVITEYLNGLGLWSVPPSGASEFIPGTTAVNYSALPPAAANTGLLALVLNNQGVWMINFYSKGIYYSDGVSWLYEGDYMVTDNADHIINTPAGTISSTTVQGAIDELDTEKVPSTRTVNGYALSANVSLVASDVGAPSGSGTSTGSNTGDQTNITGNAGTVTNGVYTTDAGTVFLAPTGNGSGLSGITAAQVGAPSGSGTSTGSNTGDQTNITGNAGTVTNGVYTTDAGTVFLAPTGNGSGLSGITATQVGAPAGSGTSTGTNTGDNATNSQYSGLAASKQDTLVSGTNIKTINGATILGAGNLTVSGGSTIDTVEVDLGSEPVPNGEFTITGAGFTVGKPVIITQAPGAYTGKGSYPDEIELDQLTVAAYIFDSTTIKCNWGSNTRVRGNVKFNYMVGA